MLSYLSDYSEEESSTHYLSDLDIDEYVITGVNDENKASEAYLSDSSTLDLEDVDVAPDGTVNLKPLIYDHAIKRIYDFQERIYEMDSTNIEQTAQAILQMEIENDHEIVELGLYLHTIASHRHSKRAMYQKLWHLLENKININKFCRKIRKVRLPKNDLIRSIFVDDVDKLQLICSNPDFSIDTFIDPPGFRHDRPITLIEYSILVGSVNCFKFLIMNRAKINPQFYDSIAQFAIIGGETEIIRTLETNTPIRIFPKYLIYAAQYQHNELFDWILEYYPGTQNQNILQECIMSHYLHGLCVFPRANLDFLFQNAIKSHFIQLIDFCLVSFSFDVSPYLVLACELNETEIVKKLLQVKDVDVDAIAPIEHDHDKHLCLYPQSDYRGYRYTRNKSFALFEAVMANNPQVVKMLIDSYANPNLIRYFGHRNKTFCLVHACAKGYYDVVKILLDCYKTKVNIRYEQDSGMIRTTALYEACRAGNVEIVKLLLQKREIEINVEVCTNHHDDDSEDFCSYYDNTESQSDVNFLPLTISFPYPKIVKLLLNQPNIDVNMRNSSNQSPIVVAINQNNLKVVRLLLEHHNIDLSSRCHIIMEAIKNENMQIFDFLINHPKITINEDNYKFFQLKDIDPIYLTKIHQVIKTEEDVEI